jgi:phosphoglycerol transferase
MTERATWLRALPRPGLNGALLAAMLASFIYLVLRSGGMYPSIFGDEWSYSLFTRLTPFSETPVPSYLYYTVYQLSSSCGTGFLDCARIFNDLFLVGSIPLIYLVARRYMAPAMAAAVAVLAVLAPSNTYTAYFMPEAMYYWGFWLFTWSVLRPRGTTGAAGVALSAAILALLAMVKVHGLFLLPGYLAYLVYCAFAARHDGGRPWLSQALLLVAVALFSAAVVRLGVGYLYGGKNGLYLLGTLYANQAQTRPGLLTLIKLALLNLRGHLLALALLFSMPLAAAALQAISRRQRAVAAAGSSKLLAYAALMLPSLVAVTALFTGIVAGSGAESGMRLHMRYYDFALPLLLLLAGAELAPRAREAAWQRKLLVAVPLVLVMLAASQYLIPHYTPNHIDSPALYGFTHQPESYRVLMWLSLCTVLLWAVRARLGAILFVFGYTPLALIIGNVEVADYARGAQQADAYVKAGLYARDYLSSDEAAQLTIVGSDIAALHKSRFLIDNRKTELVTLQRGEAVTPSALPYPAGWILVVGDHPLPDDAVVLSGAREFVLMRVPPAGGRRLHQFSQPEDGSVRSSGLSGLEAWGRWSDGPQVTLRLATPLPRKLLLRIDAAAFGPNVGRDFMLQVGAQKLPLRLGEQHSLQELRFDTNGAASTIHITVPAPTAPQEIGAGPDPRKLGISLYSLEVIDADTPAP